MRHPDHFAALIAWTVLTTLARSSLPRTGTGKSRRVTHAQQQRLPFRPDQVAWPRGVARFFQGSSLPWIALYGRQNGSVGHSGDGPRPGGVRPALDQGADYMVSTSIQRVCTFDK